MTLKGTTYEPDYITMLILCTDFSGDFKTTMKGLVDKVENLSRQTDREERMAIVDDLLDVYITQTGERPDGAILNRLANVVLREDLTDKSSAKTSNREYPFLNEKQLGRRKDGIQRRRNAQGVKYREVPLEQAQNVATDGYDYTLPIRSFTNPD